MCHSWEGISAVAAQKLLLTRQKLHKEVESEPKNRKLPVKDRKESETGISEEVAEMLEKRFMEVWCSEETNGEMGVQGG